MDSIKVSVPHLAGSHLELPCIARPWLLDASRADLAGFGTPETLIIVEVYGNQAPECLITVHLYDH